MSFTCVPSLGRSNATSSSGQTRSRQLPGQLRDRMEDRVTRGLNMEVSVVRRLTVTVASPQPREQSRRMDKIRAGSSMCAPDQETSSATISSGQTRWRTVVMEVMVEVMEEEEPLAPVL